MTTVNGILKKKGREVYVIGPDGSVFDAIRQMAEKDVGCLVVTEDGRPIGIFTERHYARNVFLIGKSSPKTSIREAMSDRTFFAVPGQTVQECMAVMTRNRVRHLPVLEGEDLAGIVSIGDLVESTISEQKFAIEQLERYIRS